MRICIIFIFFFLFLNFKAFAYNLDFFTKFNDEYLEFYIKKALENNHELKQANYLLEQYRYQIKKQFAKEFPSASVSSSYLGSHFPKGDKSFLIDQNSYILPFQVSWEPDFLLKTKDKINSQKKLYKAQIAKTDSTYITLLTDVATCYINLLLNDLLIQKQNEIVLNKIINLSCTNFKFLRGIIEIVDFNDSKKDLDEQKIILDNLVKKQNEILCNLALLTGESAENINDFKRGTLDKIEYQETIPDIINSDLIYNRPDVIEIENKLKSAKIDVTVAKKEFFPSFNVTGYLVFDTAGWGNFFSWNSSFAFLIAGLTQDIFKGGEKIANLKIQKARFKELFEQYRQIDLNAIKELNNTLFTIKQDTLLEKKTKSNVALQNKNVVASNKKFQRGTISKIENLNQKNDLAIKQQLLATSKAIRLVDYFSLYKVLGGQI